MFLAIEILVHPQLCVGMSSEDGLREEVYQRLICDLTSCDFLLSVFWAAMTSYRHDTVLRPFLPDFVLADKTKDVEALVSMKSNVDIVLTWYLSS